MPPTAKQPIRRPAIEARVSPISLSKMATYGNNPWMKMASRNTAAKQTLARGSAERRRRQFRIAERPERQHGDSEGKRAEDREDAAPAEQIADHTRDRGAEHIGGERNPE